MRKLFTEIINNIIYNVDEFYYNNKILSKTYWLNNKFHNENGPAYIRYYRNGSIRKKEFYINGKLHNKSGAADISYYLNGYIEDKYYFINGKLLKNVNSDDELKKYLKYKNF